MHIPADYTNPGETVLSLYNLSKMSTNIKEVLDSQKRIEEVLLSKMSEFEHQLQAQTTGGKPDLEKLTKEFYEFKNLVSTMFCSMNSQIQSLTSQVDSLDNFQRRDALLFSGISETENEDCIASVLNIINGNMNLPDVHPRSIYTCHRLGGKSTDRSRPILVRFTNIYTRNSVWSVKKTLKTTSVVISEFLTRTRQAIFTQARKHFGITRCWSQGGNIFIKLPDNERKRVASAQDLERLIANHPMSVSSTVATVASSSKSQSKGASKQTAVSVDREPHVSRRAAATKSKAHLK